MAERTEGLEPLQFTERLAAARAVAIVNGVMERGEYESLLLDPDFDGERFEDFRIGLRTAGVRLPDDDDEGVPVRIERVPLAGEPERDLLDLYLDEIGRFPLL
jgi:hypothetical protein